MDLMDRLQETRAYLANHVAQAGGQPPKAVVVMGSGLSGVLERWRTVVHTRLPYRQIPHFPLATIAGHPGELVVADVQGDREDALPWLTPVRVAIMLGRFHYYEGHTLADVIYPLQALRVWGAPVALLTNAAGSANPNIAPGRLVQLADVLNLMGDHPLRGPNPAALGPRFFDMSQPFCPQLAQAVQQVAQQQGIALAQGVYAGLSGPSYETPAEIRMVRTLGADLVGMSTVPEVLAARHMGMRVLGLSCVTNWAAGVLPDHTLSHQEVMETGQSEAVQWALSRLLLGALQTLAHSAG